MRLVLDSPRGFWDFGDLYKESGVDECILWRLTTRFRRRPGKSFACRGSLIRCAHSARLSSSVRRHCMNPQHIRVIGSLTALVFILAGLYCVLWIFSSASLACTACNCTYSLFASSFRCRQPYIAMILAAVFFGLAVWVRLYTRRLSASRSSTR